MPPPYATPGEAIVDRLKNQTTAGPRVFPQQPTASSTVPYTAYKKAAGAGGKRLNGRNGLQSYLFRLDCYAKTEAEAEALLKATITRLTTWSDRANGVHGCFDAEDQDDDLAEDGGGTEYRVAGQTVELWFLG